MVFNMLIGFGLLALSGVMFWAGSNWWGAAKIRGFIERRFLGGGSLMDKSAPYATEVQFLRWPLLVTAVTTVIPFTLIWQDALIAFCLLVLYYIALWAKALWRWTTARAEREELRLKKLKGNAK